MIAQLMNLRTEGREELLNAITHGIGSLLSIAALVILVVFASIYGTPWHVVSFAIFGSMLVVLYSFSTLYHSLRGDKIRHLFRKFDHMSIYLLIAGTYTPFCLGVIKGWIGWTIFGVVWGCCVLGITLKALYTGKKEFLSTILYVLMGWIILIAIKPLYHNTPTQAFVFLFIGGILYTVGIHFFLNERIKYSHAIWHLFVLAGSIFHFFSVLSLLTF